MSNTKIVDIIPYGEDSYIVLVNGLDEIGEHMSLADAISSAEDELVSWQGFTKEDAEEYVNDLVQYYL